MSDINLNFKLSKILDEASEKIEKKSDEISKKVASDVAKELRETSPKRTGEYAKNWSSKKTDGGYTVYNKGKTAHLTSLLENGHVSRNQFGTYVRVNGIPHIFPAYEKGKKEMEKLIKEIKL